MRLVQLASLLALFSAPSMTGAQPRIGTDLEQILGAVTNASFVLDGSMIRFEECSLRRALGDSLVDLDLMHMNRVVAEHRTGGACKAKWTTPQRWLDSMVVRDSTYTLYTLYLAPQGGANESWVVQRRGPIFYVESRRQWLINRRG
jgi:hypothetical protein